VTELETKWIEQIVSTALACEPGDRVVLETFDVPGHLLHRISSRINKTGAHTVVWPKTWANLVELVNNLPDGAIQGLANEELESLKRSQKFLSIRAATPNDLQGISNEGFVRWVRHWLGPVHYRYRVNQMRWCSVKWPHKSLATKVGRPDLEEEYYAASVNPDPSGLARAAESVTKQLPPGSRVRIVGSDTDLQFTLIPNRWIYHFGHSNLPDGEIFTAPRLESVNGHLTAKGPISFMGMELQFLWLEFDNGMVTHARTNEPYNKRMNSIFTIDAGAGYIGEVGIGLNPLIRSRLGDSMWDEKAIGTIHVALGNAYASADNGNRSFIHWDIVVELNDKRIWVNEKEITPGWIT
jgi:aminopeptidase